MKLSELIAELQSFQRQVQQDPEVSIRLIDHDDVSIHHAPIYEVVAGGGPLDYPEAVISGVPPEMAEELELDE